MMIIIVILNNTILDTKKINSNPAETRTTPNLSSG